MLIYWPRRQAKGYEPEALLNFVALLGWSPQSSAAVVGEGTGEDGAPAPAVAEEGKDVEEKDTDVLSMDEMIEQVRPCPLAVLSYAHNDLATVLSTIHQQESRYPVAGQAALSKPGSLAAEASTRSRCLQATRPE